MTQIAWMLLILCASYGVILVGLAWVIGKWQAIHAHATFWSFFIFGLVSGTLALMLWPNDSCILPNVFGVWLGDWMYVQAIEWMGDPRSSQAGTTIPWIFRVPQVYVIASTGLCGSVGAALQWINDRTRKR